MKALIVTKKITLPLDATLEEAEDTVRDTIKIETQWNVKQLDTQIFAKTEVKVRVKFCALDWRVLSCVGANHEERSEAAFEAVVPGWEFVGVVEDVGENVSRFYPGQEVAGVIPQGYVQSCACAEYVQVFEGWLVRKPAQLNGALVAVSLGAGQLAYRAVYDKMKPAKGQGIALVFAALTACGSLAIQLLLKLDIYVIMVAVSEEEAAALRSMLEQGCVMGPFESNLALVQEINDATDFQGVDYVFDANRPVPRNDGRRPDFAVLGFNGVWVTRQCIQLSEADSKRLACKNASICFVSEQNRLNERGDVRLHVMNDLLAKLEKTEIALSKPEEYSIEDAIAAVAKLGPGLDTEQIVIRL